jgi:hypothetical protein
VGLLRMSQARVCCCKRSFRSEHVQQADAYRGAERLGQFQLLADWRLQDMQQWVLVSHQKEDDTAALERYRKQVRRPDSSLSHHADAHILTADFLQDGSTATDHGALGQDCLQRAQLLRDLMVSLPSCLLRHSASALQDVARVRELMAQLEQHNKQVPPTGRSAACLVPNLVGFAVILLLQIVRTR